MLSSHIFLVAFSAVPRPTQSAGDRSTKKLLRPPRNLAVRSPNRELGRLGTGQTSTVNDELLVSWGQINVHPQRGQPASEDPPAESAGDRSITGTCRYGRMKACQFASELQEPESTNGRCGRGVVRGLERTEAKGRRSAFFQTGTVEGGDGGQFGKCDAMASRKTFRSISLGRNFGPSRCTIGD
jgi:hypothetical protein